MAITVIEHDTMNCIQNACKEYVKNACKIDWEQRRYEIAKDVLCALIREDYAECSIDCQMAVLKADQLIAELKK